MLLSKATRVVTRIRPAVFTVISAAMVLGACGYKPLYGSQSVAPHVERRLASIYVAPIKDRAGQMMRLALKKRLSPTADGLENVYTLNITLSESLAKLAVEESGFTTRANLKLHTSFKLFRSADQALIFEGKVKTVSSYNELSSDFATKAAQDDARQRAITDLADTLRTRLATFFQGPALNAARPIRPSTYP